MPSLSTAIELVSFGILLGTLYALLSIGLSLIFGVCGVVNLAHGDFVMLGAYTTFWAWSLLGVNPILTLPLAMALLFALGYGLSRGLVLRVSHKGQMATMMLTFGVSLVLWNTAEVAFTPLFRSVEYLVEPVSLGFVTAAGAYFAAFALAVVLLVIFFAMLKYTRFGQAIRAAAQNRQMALACGIDVRRIDSVAFALGAMLAGACGTMVAMVYTISPQMGLSWLTKAFAIVVIGGLGSIPGAFLGAYIFGIAESVGTHFLSTRMAQVLPFAIIILILVVRRGGLLAGKGGE
jgi:branched-chain amino acid transport system permease protein